MKNSGPRQPRRDQPEAERPRRTQADRTATTKTALINAARTLFAEVGFSQVGTEAIVAAAGVSRGALYHQFGDKTELFAAVVEEVERDIAARLGQAAQSADSASSMLIMAIERWLELCAEPEVQRIVLLDGPSVLGWGRWRQICQRHVLGLIQVALEQGMATGEFDARPIVPLSHALIAVADEAALYVVSAADPAVAGQEMITTTRQLLSALTPGRPG